MSEQNALLRVMFHNLQMTAHVLYRKRSDSLKDVSLDPTSPG